MKSLAIIAVCLLLSACHNGSQTHHRSYVISKSHETSIESHETSIESEINDPLSE